MRRVCCAQNGCSPQRAASPGLPKPTLQGTVKNSAWRAKNAPTCASSSSGAKVQVEYTRRPPGRSAAAAASNICAPSAAQRCTSAWLCWRTACGSLRNMPSPEHGASTSTLSNQPGSAAAMRAGASFSTTAFATPMRSRFDFKIFALAASYSLATKSPRPPSAPASWALLPPGAAHMSSTRWPGCTSKRGAGAAALASCT